VMYFQILDRRSKMRTASSFSGWLSIFVALLVLVACRQPSTDDAASDTPLVPSVTSIEAPKKILFIGNSFTYYNGGVDRHLERLAASTSPSIELVIESHTVPSRTLKGHYYDNATRRALSRQNWDVVVLQGASYEPVDHTTQQEFFDFARRLNSDIKETGAQTVFFMTWAWKTRPGMSVKLRNAYVKLGNEIDALVIPVGLAWEKAQEKRSFLSLYSDSRHSNVKGTYLAACVFYASLLGQSPVKLPYTAGIEDGDARFLQQVALETTKLFYNH